jgi:Domain of unknown function (DUF1906)
MKVLCLAAMLTVAALQACKGSDPAMPRAGVAADPPVTNFVGFDRNGYPGDGRLAELHKSFAFAGYWLNNPPGAKQNGWQGKRQKLVDAGFGFLVLWNGRLDAEIKRAKMSAEALGQKDAADAIAAAQREGFLAHTILFLDQEEGGRLLPEQAAYFFGWTEAVAASSFLPGSYLSGQPVSDGNGPDGKPQTITTAQDIRQQVAARHLHPVALWVAQDACPPAPGCTINPPDLEASGMDRRLVGDDTVVIAWQYAQSPRRPAITRSCAQTYSQDGNCYAGVTQDLFLDLDVAWSADPSHGRGVKSRVGTDFIILSPAQ